jgi:secreted PhoX family phosphatase
MRDPKGIVNLPKGFNYKIISRTGNKMNDGFLVPGMMDGMGTFLGRNGNIIVVRNHELAPGNIDIGAFAKDKSLMKKIPTDKYYDFGKRHAPSLGGTTTFVYNPNTMEIEKEFLSLIGTVRNCSGGVTPWKTWLSCEEHVSNTDDHFEKNHGYNFEVPISEEGGLAEPIPLKAMGRFNHEAVAVHPSKGIIYQTEDRDDSLFYRFLPNQYGELKKGGKLQALSLKESKQFDTRNRQDAHMLLETKYSVEWQTLQDVDSLKDDLRWRGFSQGAALFARGEGNYYSNGKVYFTCTSGGKKKLGQVFRYTPSPFEGQTNENEQPATLELFVEANNQRLLRNCDNLTSTRLGDLIICEDRPDPRLLGITPEGQIYHFAKNIGFRSEFTGVCFSPDGNTMFVNIQSPGLTLAITGPWNERLP